MNPSQTLSQAFCAKVNEIVDSSGDRCRDWSLTENKRGQCTLLVPKLNAEGFEVTVVVDETEISVFTEYIAHAHFTSDGKHGEIVACALGLVRDLLSPGMRVRVYEAGGSPYRGDLEVFDRGVWKREWSTSLFVFTWFRRKSQKVFANHRMPSREHPLIA